MAYEQKKKWYGNTNGGYRNAMAPTKAAVVTADNITIQEVQKIEKNFDKFLQLIRSVENDELRTKLEALVIDVKSRYCVAPASSRTDYIGAYAGGLVQTSLMTLKYMLQMNDALDLKVSKDDILVAALFFHLGKIGNAEQEYYIAQTSSWHIERGMRYEINKNLDSVMAPNIRSIWWLNNAGVPMSEDVIYSISSMSTMTGGNSSFGTEVYQAPKLAILLQAAFRLVCTQASDTPKKSILD